MTVIKRRGKRGTRYGVKISRSGGVQEWIGTFDKLKDAKQAELRALSRPRSRRDETCDSFAERWVRDYPRSRDSTNRTNENAVRKFAEDPQFRGVKLDDLDRATARDWARNNPSRHSSVRAMFYDALNDELCSTNPFANLRLPLSRGRMDMTPITETELDDLCDCALKVHDGYGTEFRALIIFAAYTLMRPGEIFVLDWSDVNLDIDNPTVSVTKTLSGDTKIERPKNGRSREIVLPPPARDALLSLPHRSKSGRIFSTVTGKRFRKSSFHYAWNPVRLAFGKPKMDFYELKHYGCTYSLDILYMSAADVALQCGHTDGGTLVSTRYGHPSEKRARERIRAAWREGHPDSPLKLVQ